MPRAVFAILSNGRQEQVMHEAMEMLRSASHVPK